jgi:hypothetical protein
MSVRRARRLAVMYYVLGFALLGFILLGLFVVAIVS